MAEKRVCLCLSVSYEHKKIVIRNLFLKVGDNKKKVQCKILKMCLGKVIIIG